jgi:acetyl-CoA acetyltransferase
MSESVILAGACTPSGDLFSALGGLDSLSLLGIVIESALERAGVTSDLDYAIIGQEQARRVVRRAHVPDTVPAVSVSGGRWCGLHAIALADHLIRTRERDVVVVGGVDPEAVAPFPGTFRRRAREGAVPAGAPGGILPPANAAADPGAAVGALTPRRAECAVAIVLMRRTRAEQLSLPWLARVGAHGTAESGAGSSYADAERALHRALCDMSATPKDLSLLEVHRSTAGGSTPGMPGPLSGRRYAFDTTGMRVLLRLAQSLERGGRGMGAVSMWGDHPAEALVICSPAR